MLAPDDKETYEVTLELEGEVSPEAFAQYKAELQAAIEKLRKISSRGQPLKVRWVRTAIKRK